MKLTDFKKQLAETGVSYSVLLERNARVAHIVKSSPTFTEAINMVFTWAMTPEGHSYWDAVSNGFRPITKAGVVLPTYVISTSGDDWHVGCERITRKQRMLLFKLLADDLGYTLED